MKKLISYILLFSGIIFIALTYIYRQYQYNRFEELFMNARIYGDSKIVLDTVLTENNKRLGLDIRKYKYLFFLKNRKENFSRGFYTSMSYGENSRIIGNGGAGDDFFNEIPIFGVKNIIYAKFIPEKWVPNKSSAYYIIVEYENKRRIQYYIEVKEKIENKKYTVYFKSYPPKMILNAKNQYIKD